MHSTTHSFKDAIWYLRCPRNLEELDIQDLYKSLCITRKIVVEIFYIPYTKYAILFLYTY